MPFNWTSSNGVKALFGLAVRIADPVCPGKVLAIVDGKVYVVEGVVRGTVYDGLEGVAGDHVRVVDEDGPKVDKDEEAEVDHAVEGEEEYE